MADKKKLTVAEMLAAARAEKGGAPPPAKPTAAPQDAPAESAAAESAGEEAAAPAEPKKPVAKPTAKPAAAGGKMTVAEMMAAARAEKAGGAKPAAAESAAPVVKVEKPAPAAKPAAKVAPKAPAAEAAGTAKAPDTSSILASLRAGAAKSGAGKLGPVSKSEAAAIEKAKGGSDKPVKQAPPMPEKPAYAMPVPPRQSADKLAPASKGAATKGAKKGEEVPTRRGFVGTFFGSFLAVGFSSLGLTSLLGTLGIARFMFPNILTEPPTKFKVGFPDSLSAGQVETKFIAQYGVWVVKYEYNGKPEIYALKSVCTHLGCTPSWLEAEQKFKCPCHGSGFYKDGINFEGPAPRPLERYAIFVADDGQLEVDKSRTFQEEMGQWKDPASFVNV